MNEFNDQSNQPNQSIPPNPSGPSPSTPPRRRCLYYEAFTEEEKRIYEIIRDAEALDEEIELLRVRIFAMAAQMPLDMKIMISALHCLNSMCKTNVKYYKRGTQDINKIYHDILPLFKGINIPVEFADMKLT